MSEVSFWRKVFPYANLPAWRWVCGFGVFAVFVVYGGWKERKRRAARAAVKGETTRAN
jgi:hypothetical protein